MKVVMLVNMNSDHDDVDEGHHAAAAADDDDDDNDDDDSDDGQEDVDGDDGGAVVQSQPGLALSMVPPAPPLPPGWEQAVDPASGNVRNGAVECVLEQEVARLRDQVSRLMRLWLLKEIEIVDFSELTETSEVLTFPSQSKGQV
eukprot:s521_g9.t1